MNDLVSLAEFEISFSIFKLKIRVIIKYGNLLVFKTFYSLIFFMEIYLQ